MRQQLEALKPGEIMRILHYSRQGVKPGSYRSSQDEKNKGAKAAAAKGKQEVLALQDSGSESDESFCTVEGCETPDICEKRVEPKGHRPRKRGSARVNVVKLLGVAEKAGGERLSPPPSPGGSTSTTLSHDCGRVPDMDDDLSDSSDERQLAQTVVLEQKAESGHLQVGVANQGPPASSLVQSTFGRTSMEALFTRSIRRAV